MEQLTIKQYLNQYKVLQTDFAKELEISDSMVSKLIRSRYSISKSMQKRLIDYFNSKDIQIVFTEPQLNKTKLEEQYEELEKAYDILQLKCLELIEENKILKEGMKNIINLGEKLKNISERNHKKCQNLKENQN